MRHYEIIFMVHPDQSDQVAVMLERYRAMITSDGGIIHRMEDWGRRQLAYSINKLHKAHYILLNIEAEKKVIDDLKTAFRFNDAVIRSMIINVKNLVSELSPIMKVIDERHERVENFVNKNPEQPDINC